MVRAAFAARQARDREAYKQAMMQAWWSARLPLIAPDNWPDIEQMWGDDPARFVGPDRSIDALARWATVLQAKFGKEAA